MNMHVNLLLIAMLLSSASDSQACTTIGLTNANDRLVAKSYDWHIEDAFVISNKKGVRKKSLVFKAGDTPVQWISVYNSVTFNQYGREFPNSGMNEKGLVAEVMVLDSSGFPLPDQRAVTNESQIVQQVLDTSANVGEAVARFRAARMSPIMVRLHYLVCDLSECAIVEYRNGREMIYRDAQAPHTVLTNDDYDSSLRTLSLYSGFGGSRQVPAQSTDSLKRFVIAASEAKAFAAALPARPIEAAFTALERVETGGTQWMIVYDQSNQTIHFKTSSARIVKQLDVGTSGPLMSGNCKSARVEVLPMVDGNGGDRTASFRAYQSDENEDIIRRHLNGQVPPAIVDAAVAYPDSVVCTVD